MKTKLLLVLSCLVLAGCTPSTFQPEELVPSEMPTSLPSTPTPEPAMGLPNPASVFCEQQGYTLEIRTAEDGSQSGWCIFPDGSECDEWAYFRGECQPASELSTPEPSPEATAEFASDGCRVYRNEDLGYSFHYPADAQIVNNDDPLQGISVVGPTINNESWPFFSLSHPGDREDYRLPEDADLLQWLTDHYLLGDERAADVQIAGTTAIHLRHERSPQSYAYDRYYFAREGQLYMIVIGHTGDQEDWDLYNHFLSSIQFE